MTPLDIAVIDEYGQEEIAKLLHDAAKFPR